MGGQVTSPALVGRARELAVLDAALGRADGGASAVVLLGGEAGVGKTRLVTEFAAGQVGTGTRVLIGGCVPLADGELPFAPAVEALRDLVGQLGVERVRALAGPSWPELARLLPALGDPGRAGAMPPPEPTDQARLFELLIGLLGALADQAALILVVEDLHWADRSTRDLLAFLARNLRRQRVVLVATHRSDEPERPWLGPFLAELGRAGAERLELDRLGRAESAAQMAAIRGAMPPLALVEGVFARAEGNPFFTEELLAATHTGPAGLPATLHDLLRGRIQAVSEPARQVLRVAAVVGRRAPHRLVAAVAGLDDRRLDQALREAVAGKLLATRPGGTATSSGTPCSGRSPTPTCCRASGPGSTARSRPRSPPIPDGPAAPAPPWPPSSPTTGRPPGTWSAPCRPRSRPASRPSGPTPSPRPTGSSSAPWSCGPRCRGRPT
jgi:predicted ATPase